MIRKYTNKSKTAAVSFSIYTDCNELPMLRFVNVLCGNELKYLVKEGNPPQDVLKQTWEHIYEQYLNLCTGDEGVTQYMMQLRVDQKQLHIEMLHSLRECISEGYHISGFPKKIADRLNSLMKLMKLQERFTLDADKLAGELQSLRIITNETVLELNELQAELKFLQKDTEEEDKTITPDHFYQWSISMSTYFKYSISLNTTTVSEFEQYRKSYKLAVQREMQGRK
jgi:hypothetical protein